MQLEQGDSPGRLQSPGAAKGALVAGSSHPVHDDLKPLFRYSVRSAASATQIGEILLVAPSSYRIVTLCTGLLITCVCALLAFGSYTRRATVSGHLVPDKGILRILAPNFGTVIEKHVLEGQLVHTGDVLFVLSGERLSTIGETQAFVSKATHDRVRNLQGEAASIRQVTATEYAVAIQKLALMKDDLNVLREQLAHQESHIKLAVEAKDSNRHLAELGYVSKEQAKLYELDLLDQRAKLQTIKRDILLTRRAIDEQRATAEVTPIKGQRQIDEVERDISLAQVELSENEAKRRMVIKAPQDGLATVVLGEIGQTVDPTRSLVSLVPVGSVLQAELYAGSAAIGFVRVDQRVRLRFPAFPYQKFGHFDGTVQSVTRSATSASELMGFPVSTVGGGEPMYQVVVRLSSQTVLAYGTPRPLQAGMQVNADLLQERRPLYEWILDPLYSIRGDFK